MPILGKDDNTLENFELYEDEESILEEQNIEEDHANLVSKSLDTRSRGKTVCQDILFKMASYK